jgi:hypothetical protein
MLAAADCACCSLEVGLLLLLGPELGVVLLLEMLQHLVPKLPLVGSLQHNFVSISSDPLRVVLIIVVVGVGGDVLDVEEFVEDLFDLDELEFVEALGVVVQGLPHDELVVLQVHQVQVHLLLLNYLLLQQLLHSEVSSIFENYAFHEFISQVLLMQLHVVSSLVESEALGVAGVDGELGFGGPDAQEGPVLLLLVEPLADVRQSLHVLKHVVNRCLHEFVELLIMLERLKEE